MYLQLLHLTIFILNIVKNIVQERPVQLCDRVTHMCSVACSKCNRAVRNRDTLFYLRTTLLNQHLLNQYIPVYFCARTAWLLEESLLGSAIAQERIYADALLDSKIGLENLFITESYATFYLISLAMIYFSYFCSCPSVPHTGYE